LVDCSGNGENEEDDDQPQEYLSDPPHDPSGRSAAHNAKTNPLPGLVHVPKAYSPECVEEVFREGCRRGVLRSWLLGSGGGIMLVVERDIPL
jgi:hypothetical protein